MKLAEALALRADTQKRFEQVQARLQSSARYQEGEAPAEKPGDLLAEAESLLGEFEDLIRRINRTNAVTETDAGATLTDALARRDVLRVSRGLYASAADAATGHGASRGWAARQTRSELR